MSSVENLDYGQGEENIPGYLVINTITTHLHIILITNISERDFLSTN